MAIRVATDIGGTFTDLVHYDEETGRLGVAKASTTPPNFEQGVIDALAKASFDRDAGVSFFAHGTTVIINALTERRGAKVGLITTKGFRDVLAIGRANRPDLYNMKYRKPEPFVPRHRCLEVEERVDYLGRELTPLAEVDVKTAVERFKAEGVDAVAICFIHAYANPEHERRCAEIVHEQWPGVFVSMSHEISKEWREYERTSTVVLNSYVQPVADAYIDKLGDALGESAIMKHRYIMQSNGGTASFERSKQAPINMVESGPVAGVMGAAVIGTLIGEPNIISLDIGGTTAKCSLIEQGEVKTTTEYKIEWSPTTAGYPIKAPVVDIVEIGAGGGSIAWIDAGGALRVGPKSAGAVPGPACYGQGGTEPTVTDANLIAGRINPDYFLGGEIKVDVELARKAMGKIADALGVSVDDAALGVIRIANASMVNALKLVSVRRGYDPREFDMVASGGGGSMHAAALAAELQLKRVIVPNVPGHFSAWGMLMTDLRNDWVQTMVARADQADPADLNARWAELEAEATAFFANEGVAANDIILARAADMRYLGQEHTVKIPIPSGDLAGLISSIRERFDSAHQQTYAFSLPNVPIEFVNIHLTGFGRVPKPEIRPIETAASGDGSHGARKGERMVNYDALGWHRAAIYERERLGAGAILPGPAVIEEPAASTVVFPGQTVEVDRYGNLIISTNSQSEA